MFQYVRVVEVKINSGGRSEKEGRSTSHMHLLSPVCCNCKDV